MPPRLTLLVVSFSTLAYAQSAVPAVEPAIEPPSFPAPAYTPAGTGAPVVGQPGDQTIPVPRSPNLRVLPSTPEPGFWAADEVRAVKKPTTIQADTDELLLPQPSPGAPELRSCRQRVLRASQASGEEHLRQNLPRTPRDCITARLLLFCANRELAEVRAKLSLTPRLKSVDDLLKRREREAHETLLWQSRICESFRSLPGLESLFTAVATEFVRQSPQEEDL